VTWHKQTTKFPLNVRKSSEVHCTVNLVFTIISKTFIFRGTHVYTNLLDYKV